MTDLATLDSPARWLLAPWKPSCEGCVVYFSIRVSPMLNKLSTTPWRSMREWRYSSSILDLSTRRRWMVAWIRDTDSGTHWMGSWVSPRAGLNDVEKRKVSAPAVNWTRAVQPVSFSIPTELSRHVQLYHTFLTDAGFDLHLGRVIVNWPGATPNSFNVPQYQYHQNALGPCA
jgi:hypothetical protein